METFVTAWTLPLTAIAAGFLGSVHCLGMCGGVSGTVALAARPTPSAVPKPAPGLMAVTIPIHVVSTSAVFGANILAFNLGRVASYAIAGAIAGNAGAVVASHWLIGESFSVRAILFVFANVMIVLTGLYLMGFPQLLAPLERAGGRLWKHLSPFTKKILPIDSISRAAAFGLLWGWIPCGLVYAMLLTAMSAGSASKGALTMLAFGLGTLPAMISAGLAAGGLRRWTREPRVRLVAGAVIVGLGMIGFARTGAMASLQAFGAYCVSITQAAP